MLVGTTHWHLVIIGEPIRRFSVVFPHDSMLPFHNPRGMIFFHKIQSTDDVLLFLLAYIYLFFKYIHARYYFIANQKYIPL